MVLHDSQYCKTSSSYYQRKTLQKKISGHDFYLCGLRYHMFCIRICHKDMSLFIVAHIIILLEKEGCNDQSCHDHVITVTLVESVG